MLCDRLPHAPRRQHQHNPDGPERPSGRSSHGNTPSLIQSPTNRPRTKLRLGIPRTTNNHHKPKDTRLTQTTTALDLARHHR
jgi:hypothetical protein